MTAKDIVGNDIEVGSIIVWPEKTKLHFGTVEKVNPKMAKVKMINQKNIKFGPYYCQRRHGDILVITDSSTQQKILLKLMS